MVFHKDYLLITKNPVIDKLMLVVYPPYSMQNYQECIGEFSQIHL